MSPKRAATTLLWPFALLTTTSTLALGTIKPIDPSKNITWPYQVYKTVPYQPPWLNITQSTSPSEGYLFFAPDGATETQLGPVIMDTRGELVWNGPKEHAFNFGVYSYQGEAVLGWWNGTVFPEPVGRGNGVVNLYSKEYERLREVSLAGNFLELQPGATFPSNIDLHELIITPKGSLVVTANNVTQADLTSVGGPKDGWVVNALFYEIDIATNDIIFQWSALDHISSVPFNASFYPLGSEGYNGTSQSTAWGWFHINAVEPYDGGYILSSRYLCSAIAIDGVDGHVKWRLSGRGGGDFTLVGSDATTGFCYQHDVRTVDVRESGVTLSMHDNHNSPIENDTVPTTAKWVDVDFGSKKATLVHRYLNTSGPVFSTAQGNVQQLWDGNVFVGHGWIPVMEEYSSTGGILSTIQFGAAVPRPEGGYLSAHAATLSYRGFKQRWTGCPSTPPDVAVEKNKSELQVYVSWNGATDVAAWEVYGGVSEELLQLVTTVRKHGFESEGRVGNTTYIQVKPVLQSWSTCHAISSKIITVK